MTDQSLVPDADRVPGREDKPRLAIKRIFVKDVSFEVPLGIEVYGRQWQPTINQDIATVVNTLADDRYEVVLKVTVSVEQDEQLVCFAEVHQVGIFVIAGVSPQALTELLNIKCPEILFPYVRELIDNLVVRGSFPALMLPPVNFEQAFQVALAEQNNDKTINSQSTKPVNQ
jgi:preprotein translocase subunit SecB